MSDDMTTSQIEAIMDFFRKEFPDESVEVEAGHRQPTLLDSSSNCFMWPNKEFLIQLR